jgi:hypothetical protein
MSDAMPTFQHCGRALRLERHGDGTHVTVDCGVASGPVTVLGFARSASGNLKLIVAEGWVIAELHETDVERAWLRFAMLPEVFYEQWSAEGSTYEVILGAGHVAGAVCATARTLHIACTWVR